MYVSEKNGLIRKIILLCIVSIMASCTSSGKQNAEQLQPKEQVERLQNNTEYSAVESEWNELYQ